MEHLAILNLSEFPPGSVNLAMALAIALGTLYCFLGYRTFRFVLRLSGFLLAGATAGVLAAWLSEGRFVVTLVATLAGGVAGALAFFFLYRVGVFCLGMVGAAVIAHSMLAGQAFEWSPWAILGAAVVGGLLALVLERFFMTLATAAIGAWMLVGGVAYFLLGSEVYDAVRQPVERFDPQWVILACWGVVTLAGAVAQFATHRPKPKPAPTAAK